MDAWWTMQQAGAIGGWLGGGIGVIFGAVGGGIGGPLAGKGKAKPLVIGIFVLGIALGVGLMAAGLVAISLGQPRHVWYVLVHPGGLVAVLCGLLLPLVILPAYRKHEARRLAAEELRRG